MPTIKNVFTGAKMSKDVDERLLKKGEYRHAKNIRIANSEGSDVGAIEKSLSNRQLTGLNLGRNVKTIGGTSDEFEEKLYWLIKSDLGCFIIEYDTINQLASFVLKDTRKGDKNVLALDENYLVTGIAIIVDTDNNNRFLIYTDNNTQPKFINIERAKTYGENGFDKEMILLIKKPPIFPPEIKLKRVASKEGNNIETVFLRFAYRYIYLDGERSAISPFSKVAFKPKRFEYDFNYSSNEGMINDFNQVVISFNSGSSLVTDVEIIFLEDGKNNPYLIGTFNKEDKKWNNNQEYSIKFSNNKIFKNLPEKQLYRLYDNVPLKAKALEVIDSRLVFGNYAENFNLKDKDGNDIFASFSLIHLKKDIPNFTSAESCKTNREYEVAIVYLDEYGRMTTPLISSTNTIFIENKYANKQNLIAVHLNSKPPFWAKYYRFFIKQSRRDYDIIIPHEYYEENGFTWVGIKDKDADKIKAEDYLIVKADTKGVKDRLVKARVISVEKKKEEKRNGWYFKTIADDFRLNSEDVNIYNRYGFDSSTSANQNQNPMRNIRNYIEQPVYYGHTHSNEKRLSSSGNYNGVPAGVVPDDRRYLIEIDLAEADKDSTFRWSKDNGLNWVAEKIAITGGEQTLEKGVKIKFSGKRGFSLNDKWIVSAKSYWNIEGRRRAYASFCPEQDFIPAKTELIFFYIEESKSNLYFRVVFETTKNYANLEEWYWGDKAYEVFEPKIRGGWRTVRFRRGRVNKYGNAHHFTQDPNNGVVCMIINAEVDGRTTWSKVHWRLFVVNYKSIPLFETEANKESDDVFYEISRTYKIENGLHKASNHTTYGHKDHGGHQEFPASIHYLPFFNCFSFGNGFESIKIKDLFNANSLSIQTRPSVPVENYRQNTRIASLTYGKQYDQSMGYNGLNEFNMAELNFKDLDDKYGAIQKIMTYDTNLDVWQEDKVHRVLYGKSTLYNEDGSSNVGKSNMVLGTVVPYAGEFGISTHPESLVAFGNYRYWADAKRGVVVRKGQSGIEIISKHGMRDWFRDYFRANHRAFIFGAYDPYYNQYTLHLRVSDKKTILHYFNNSVIKLFSQKKAFTYFLKLNDLTGDIKIYYKVKGSVSVVLEYGEQSFLRRGVKGSGYLSFERPDLLHSKAKITITPETSSADYEVKNVCPTGRMLDVIYLVLTDTVNPNLYSVIETELQDRASERRKISFSRKIYTRGFAGVEGSVRTPFSGQKVCIRAVSRRSRKRVYFEKNAGNKLGYFVSDKPYSSEDGIAELLSKATFPNITTKQQYRTKIDEISFLFKRTGNRLYLIWDYREEKEEE